MATRPLLEEPGCVVARQEAERMASQMDWEQVTVLAQRELEVCLRGVSDGKGQGESLTTL
jgi:hypothetical protein